MKRLALFAAAFVLLSLPAAAEAGPLRKAGRALKAVAGKVLHGAGRVLRLGCGR